MVTSKYRLDQYGNVYDACGVFYCKKYMLTRQELKIVKRNKASA